MHDACIFDNNNTIHFHQEVTTNFNDQVHSYNLIR